MTSTKAIWIAGLGTVLATFQLVIIGNYIVIFLKEDLLAAIIIITIIVSLRNLLQLLFRVPFGDLSQIIGRKPLILFGHFSLTVALILMSIADHWFWILFSILFVALGMSAFWPCLLAYVSDFSPENSSGGSIGRIFQMADLGSIIGLLISNLTLDELLWSLRDLFGLAAGMAFLFGLVNVKLLPEGLDKADRKQVSCIPRAIIDSFFSMLSSLKHMTLIRGLTRAYIYQFIVAITEFTTSTFLPLLILQKGYTRGDVAEIGFWAIILSIWFKPFLGRLTDKFRFIYVITITLIIYSLALLVFTVVQDFLILILLYICLNVSMMTSYMAENNEVSRSAPIEFRGTALGALGFYVSLGRTTSTIVSGPIWEILDLNAVFYILTFSILVITMILFLLYKIKEQDFERGINSPHKN
ncbi:MAG: MFS transporter [Candidatus Heimdallarchaeota archaeon]|nr:MAG: MFS transporter [Candidatus Heimdallarchaeota archaeon]